MSDLRSRGGLSDSAILVLRYVIAGGIAAATQVAALAYFVEIVGLHYLRGVVAAFCVALLVAFTLQKYWTFRKRTMDGAHREFILYTAFALLSLLLNGSLMFFFVEYLGMWYLAAQCVTVVCVAGVTFFLNRRFTFQQSTV